MLSPARLLTHTPSRARACSATCIGFPCRDRLPVLGISHFSIAFFLQKSAGAGRLFPDQSLTVSSLAFRNPRTQSLSLPFATTSASRIAVETLQCVDPKKFVEATAVWRKCYLEIM